MHGRGVSLDAVRVAIRHRSSAQGGCQANNRERRREGGERGRRMVVGGVPSSSCPLPFSSNPDDERDKRERERRNTGAEAKMGAAAWAPRGVGAKSGSALRSIWILFKPGHVTILILIPVITSLNQEFN